MWILVVLSDIGAYPVYTIIVFTWEHLRNVLESRWNPQTWPNVVHMPNHLCTPVWNEKDQKPATLEVIPVGKSCKPAKICASEISKLRRS